MRNRRPPVLAIFFLFFTLLCFIQQAQRVAYGNGQNLQLFSNHSFAYQVAHFDIAKAILRK